MKPSVPCLLIAVSVAAATAAARAQCPSGDWLPRFEGGDVGGAVRAFAKFDPDGPGAETESLYVVHYPRYTNAATTAPVQRWDGRNWQPVGGVELQMSAALDGKRCALAVFDEDGAGPRLASLFVAGNLVVNRNSVTEGGNVARLDADGWHAVGGTPFFDASKWVFDLEVFDPDAAGPAPELLVACGETGLHTWNGSQWGTLDSSTSPQFPTHLFDLQVWDADGGGPALASLYAAGAFEFQHPGGTTGHYVARWTGAEWSPLGAGSTERPDVTLALAVFDADGTGPAVPALYALSATSADPARHQGGLVRWDGVSWLTVRSFAVPVPTAHPTTGGPQLGRMIVHDDDVTGPIAPALYVAANADPNDPAWGRVSRWSGTTWISVGVGPGRFFPSNNRGNIDALASFDLDGVGAESPRLVMGGGFNGMAQGAPDPCAATPLDERSANFIATWNGQSLGSLGSGLVAPFPSLPLVSSIRAFDPDGAGATPEMLFVHGTFNTAGPTSIPLRMCQGYSSLSISSANARYTAAGWERAMLEPDADPRLSPRRILSAIEFDADGAGPGAAITYIAGSFKDVGVDAGAGPIAQWNPTLNGGAGAWQNLGAISGGETVHALAVFDPDGTGAIAPALYAAGDFDSIAKGSSSVSGAVTKWDGAAWIGTNFVSGTTIVSELLLFDADGPGPGLSRLIAAGDFVLPTTLGNAKDIAQFDGTSWTPLGDGSFTGQADTSVPIRINALAVYDDDGTGLMLPALYVAGNFLQWTDGVMPVPCRGIARWNGASWSAIAPMLEPPIGPGGSTLAGAVGADLAVFDFDGGTGPGRESLFITGEFIVPGTSSQAMARWDGASLHALGSGLSMAPYLTSTWPIGRDLEVFDDDGPGPSAPALFVAGTFLRAGDHSSWAIAKWGCDNSAAPPPCPGDANGDRIVNFADITAVLSNWLLAGPLGDANQDGVVNFADITEVLASFLVPCD